jgi:hypothetical protein
MADMRPNILCLERLYRIERVLKGGPKTLWRMRCYHEIYEWEVEQAAEFGWVRIFFRELPRGPAARMAELCERADAKLPRPRRQIEREIGWKHREFAQRSVFECVPRGMRFCHFRMPPVYVAYLHTYPQARSKAVARAAASRLMRRRDVQAAQAWYYAILNHEVSKEEPMPRTLSGIRARLTEVGSGFARWF